MSKLSRYICRVGLALILTLSVIGMSNIAASLVSDDLTQVFPGVSTVKAAETDGHGG